MPKTEPKTLGDLLYWSYANLAMAHAAVTRGDEKYGTLHFMIRARLYAGLREGRMGLGSIVEDERLKMILPQSCSYCGETRSLAVDHLLAKSRGGPDTGDNIVWACRCCNSSKGATDVLIWLVSRDQFPSLYLLRRYLKLAIEWTTENSLLNLPLEEANHHVLPFSLASIPTKFPPPRELRMWVEAVTAPAPQEIPSR